MQTVVATLIFLVSAFFLCCAVVGYAIVIFQGYSGITKDLTNFQNTTNSLKQQAEGIFPNNQTTTPTP